MKKGILILSALLLAALAAAQDKPVAIPRKELPESAVCAVCATLGTMMTPAKPVAGVMYKGKPYYFHDRDMLAMFMKDPEAYASPSFPRPAPKLDLKGSTGKSFNAESFKGKVVLVDFWATWCEPCKQMLPILDNIYSKRKPDGLEMLSISVDQKRKDFDGFVKKQPFPNPVLLDNGKTYAAWHVTAIPALYLVKDGLIIAQWTGVTEQSKIEAEVAKALAR